MASLAPTHLSQDAVTTRYHVEAFMSGLAKLDHSTSRLPFGHFLAQHLYCVPAAGEALSQWDLTDLIGFPD